MGPLHDLVTLYKITPAGTQVAQWDFKTKQLLKSTLTLRPSMCELYHVIRSCIGPIGGKGGQVKENSAS